MAPSWPLVGRAVVGARLNTGLRSSFPLEGTIGRSKGTRSAPVASVRGLRGDAAQVVHLNTASEGEDV